MEVLVGTTCWYNVTLTLQLCNVRQICYKTAYQPSPTLVGPKSSETTNLCNQNVTVEALGSAISMAISMDIYMAIHINGFGYFNGYFNGYLHDYIHGKTWQYISKMGLQNWRVTGFILVPQLDLPDG